MKTGYREYRANVLKVVPPEEWLEDLKTRVAARIKQHERQIDSLRATGEWDRLSESERAYFENREPPTISDYIQQMEILPGIGTLSLPINVRGAKLYPWPWSVDRDEHGLKIVVAVGENKRDRARVSYFDGETLQLRPEMADAEVMMHSVVSDSSPNGREADARLLVGKWNLVQVDEHSLEEHPILTYSFRSDGTFKVQAADVPAGAATEVVSPPPPATAG